MMKILIVSPFFPYPLDVGGKVSIYNYIKQLNREHNITLLCILHPEEDKENTELLKDICEKVIVVKKRIKPRNRSRFLRIILRIAKYITAFLPFCMPFILSYRYEPELKMKLSSLLKEGFDLICYEFTQSIRYIQKNVNIPQILVEHDISYIKWERQIRLLPWYKIFNKLIIFADYIKLYLLETKAWKQVDHIITMTEVDKNIIKTFNPCLGVTAIPRGVDIEYYRSERNEQELEDMILFVGSAVNTLNIDAIRFFLKDIWPKILSRKPSAEFIIIGKGFNGVIAESFGKNVKTLGFVEDMRPYLKSTKAFVVPLINASGIRIKILEAMAAGCPIVTTSIGCEGIDLVDGEDAFIRDNTDAFADAVLRLMDSEKLRRKFSKNVREKAERNYTWEASVKMFNLLAESLKKGKAS